MGQIRNRIASGLGSVLEWYDFSLYGFFAPVLAQIFFPNNSEMVGIFKAFSIYATGFIARPIGALLFGYISDKYGRVRLLKLTPFLITLPTFLIALLPSYHAIGIFSSIGLLICRVAQGLCIGAEFSNNIIYLCESVSKKRKYFLGSIGASTGSMGIFFGSSVAALFYAIFSHQNLLSLGWRLAFGSSLIAGVVIYFLRRNLKEDFYVNKVNPIIESFKHQKSDYLKVFGLTYLSATSYYFIFVFLPNFASHNLSLHPKDTFTANALALLTHLLITISLGLMTDKIGGIIMTRIASILFIFLSFPIFYLLIQSPSHFIYCIYLFSILSSLNAASLAGLLVNVLKRSTRCTVFSFSFNLCFGVFGGITPLACFYIAEKSHHLITPVFYLIFSAIITLVTSFFIKNGLQYAKQL
jgi:MHS family proline/betaine transporter-like MFS transporter